MWYVQKSGILALYMKPLYQFSKILQQFHTHTIHVHEFACTIAQSKVIFSLWVKSGILAKILR